MADDDAAHIINDAAARKDGFEAHDIRVKGVERQARNPHRTLEVGVVDIPPCQRYPAGAELYVPIHQIQHHLKVFPGSRLLRTEKRRFTRALHSSGIEPKGHDKSFLKGKTLERRGGS